MSRLHFSVNALSIIAALAAAIAVGGGCAASKVEDDDVSDYLEPPPEDEGFQLVEGQFEVEALREAAICMKFPIPARYGEDPVFIRGFQSRLPTGTHHFFLAYNDQPQEQAEPCFEDGALVYVDEDEGGEQVDAHDFDGKMLFLAPVGEFDKLLPPGYAMYLNTGAGKLETSHHILNLTDATMPMFGSFNLLTSPADEVTHPINILNCLQQDIWVPPHSDGTATGTCTVPFDLDMVILGSHAHQNLERFEMRVFDGEQTLDEVIYVSRQWDSPVLDVLDEPLHLKAGQGLTFTCHYVNGSDEPITFGTGEHGEMCAIMSQFAYPRDRPNEIPPSLGMILFSDGATAPLIDTGDLNGPF